MNLILIIIVIALIIIFSKPIVEKYNNTKTLEHSEEGNGVNCKIDYKLSEFESAFKKISKILEQFIKKKDIKDIIPMKNIKNNLKVNYNDACDNIKLENLLQNKYADYYSYNDVQTQIGKYIDKHHDEEFKKIYDLSLIHI